MHITYNMPTYLWPFSSVSYSERTFHLKYGPSVYWHVDRHMLIAIGS